MLKGESTFPLDGISHMVLQEDLCWCNALAALMSLKQLKHVGGRLVARTNPQLATGDFFHRSHNVGQTCRKSTSSLREAIGTFHSLRLLRFSLVLA
jgi:hypothetical protein